jgi:hypothetical protein
VVACPGEQVRDVGRSREACGFGEGGRIVPEVFELVGCFHLGARGGRAELGDAAVEEVDLVVEVDDWKYAVSSSCSEVFYHTHVQHTVHREPLAAILAFRQLYTFPQAVSTQSRIGELLQLPCSRALSAFLALECLSVAGVGVAARQKVSLRRYMRTSIAQASVRVLSSRFLPPDWR